MKMGAKVFGATTFGPYSKIGEVSNVVILASPARARWLFRNSVLGMV
jgi:hypothetical protein